MSTILRPESKEDKVHSFFAVLVLLSLSFRSIFYTPMLGKRGIRECEITELAWSHVPRCLSCPMFLGARMTETLKRFSKRNIFPLLMLESACQQFQHCLLLETGQFQYLEYWSQGSLSTAWKGLVELWIGKIPGWQRMIRIPWRSGEKKNVSCRGKYWLGKKIGSR